MTHRPPPRLALAMLERFVPEGPALAGDLVEEYTRRQSRGWLWWEVVAAILFAAFRRSDEIRPLRLVDLQPPDALERSRRMSGQFRPVNLTGTPVHGVGGLGLVALALLVTIVVPGLWWALLAASVCGVLLGVAMIALGRHRVG